MKIGFIGLGIMGKPMAANLLKAGYQLMVNDHHKENIEIVCAKGAIAASYEEIGRDCELIFTMLPNGPDVRKVIMEQGVGNNMKKGSCLIDMSSINPLDSKAIAQYLADRGVEMLDAPVSGGEPKAIDGTLAFMVGGKKEVFDSYRHILEAMGSSVTLCGDIGAGNTTKLANQIIVAMNITAVSEAFTLAKMAGVDPEKVFEAIKGGLAGSTVMNAKAPMILNNDFRPGFRIELHAKDLNNALQCAQGVGAPVPFTRQIQDILKQLIKDGHGKDDHSSIANYYYGLTGCRIGDK